ncbi:acetyltransferase (GNAT) family protein [Microbacterium kyungheense]|uniref:Acetyltransferase (GNAT) family protein n=1 Tax=Microbacterium kyungheense TaxID=1263636 RepID=A0A543ERU1_9MICO|nr:acetyltransferase (GNAT) family protein [Microbacterium kyungheense]
MSAVERISLLAERARARAHGLQVVIDESPTAEFERALEHLVPAEDDVARFVHRTLAQPTGTPKRNVVVRRRGEPVLATTLRARQDHWEIATATVAPSLPIPCRAGLLESALAAIGLDILIIDHVGDAKTDFRRQKLIPFDCYVAPLHDFDFDAYWRSTRLREDIRRAQRKTADHRIVNDDLAMVEWTIDTWEGRWTDHPNDEAGAADDLRAIWPELLRRGRLMSAALVTPDGTPVASNVNMVDGDTLVGLITARNTEIPASGGSIGTLAAIACFDAARDAGLAKVDIGGYHDQYKRRLAPAGRVAFAVEIAPRVFSASTTAGLERIARGVMRRVRALAARLFRRAAD